MVCPKCEQAPSERMYPSVDLGGSVYHYRCTHPIHDAADAGPELLAACKLMCESLDQVDTKKFYAAIEQTRAAIALAEPKP